VPVMPELFRDLDIRAEHSKPAPMVEQPRDAQAGGPPWLRSPLFSPC
jgi:hypothetical protein